ADSIQFGKGVGPQRARLLGRLGIHTVEDALFFLPSRYEDRRHVKTIAALMPGERATFSGRVAAARVVRRGRRRRLFVAEIEDDTGCIQVTWYHFREEFMNDQYPPGRQVTLSGKVVRSRYGDTPLELIHPDVEFQEETGARQEEEPDRLVPVYPATEGLHQKTLRQIMAALVAAYGPHIEEFLPPAVLKRQSLIPRRDAFSQVHCPPPGQDPAALLARRTQGQVRLIFEELFLLQVGLACQHRRLGEVETGIPLQTRGPLIRQFVRHLPFELTGAQKRVLAKIMDDLEGRRPMHRLIHGDVGSGKTIVALTTLLTGVDNGYQGALMAPTELLAEQHYMNLLPYGQALGVRIDLITSGLPPKVKKQLLTAVAGGDTRIVIGTHALIQKEVRFHRLGLVVIDEQHRFGVLQREALGRKGLSPHVLVMTATPIPRSLAMTLYGDMDVSRLDELPPGRQSITTRRYFENRRQEAYDRIDGELRQGRQAYVVCPLIEESESIPLKTVTEVYEDLKQHHPGWRLGLLHGRLKKEERQRIMEAFQAGRLQVLVATTVIEVGIDVANATVILIEHAERFGLAQLHQLRGRVGRGRCPAECLLVAYSPLTQDARSRLTAMEASQDGFEIAEKDLQIRGPGDFMGTRQSGLPELKVADLIRDYEYIEAARREAFALVEKDPHLDAPEHRSLKKALRHFVGDKADLASIL
ncbi:MAG: ATP-dependent DNA helicase RecG, partial [Nitrospinaceae bacterium]